MATSKEVMAEGKCLGMDFQIDQSWRFFVPDLDNYFPDYQSMREAIERDGKKVEAAKRRKVSVPAITEAGKKFTVTGVHAGHGGLITTPKRDRHDDELYVDTPLVSEAFKEKRRLEKEMEEVGGVLEKHELKTHARYSFNPSMHSECVDKLEKIAAAATKMASMKLSEARASVPAKKKLRL